MDRWPSLRTLLPGVWLLLALPLALGCRGGSAGAPSAPAPSITSISPASGPPGTEVTLTGRNLDATSGVSFHDGVAAPFVTVSASRVTAYVPGGAATGPVRITGASGSAESGTFTVTAPPIPAPAVTAFAPTTGPAFTRVAFAGTGFTGVTGVAFGGVPAAHFRILNDGALEAVVPDGAVTGPITLLHPAGNAPTASAFTLDDSGPLPLGITRVIPASAPPGTEICLVGYGFDSVQAAAFGDMPLPFLIRPEGATILMTLPAGAVTAPITLTGPGGRTVSFPAFPVTGSAGAAPVTAATPAVPTDPPSITAITPAQGFPGTSITVTGQHLAGVRSASVGGREAVFSLADDNRVAVFVPEKDPASGPVVLRFADGPVASPGPFTVTFPPPRITGFFPVSGPPGTQVTIMGTGLASPSAVLLGPRPITSPVEGFDWGFQMLVPARAPSGPITVRTAGGEARTRLDFRVTGDHGSLDLAIAGLYVTQATQRLDRSVPLVAGRPGVLKIFLTADVPNTLKPTVQVTLTDASGATLLTRDIPAPGDGIPTRLDEYSPQAAWSLDLAGDLLQPGVRVLARILPLGDLDRNVNLQDDGYPADGRPLALDVREVAPLGITLVPVMQGGTVGWVSGASRPASRWLRTIKEVFPLKDIDLQVAPIFTFSGVISDWDSYTLLLAELEAARRSEASDIRRYYYGVVDLPPDCAIIGQGARPDDPGSTSLRVAAGFDGTAPDMPHSYSEVMAHELGHNLGRDHAPCGSPDDPDPDYPYPEAFLGAFGQSLDTGNRYLDNAIDKDLMSYCAPYWVSDYTYRKVLEARAAEPMDPFTAPAAARKALLVWGRVVDGEVTLEPALEVTDTSGGLGAGPYTLVIRDAQGTILQTRRFGATPLGDGPGGTGLFAFTLPLSVEAEASLASVEVQGPAGTNTLAPTGARAAILAVRRLPAQGVQLPRNPVAKAWRPGIVHLGWDASTHPLVLVKDAGTGAVIGMARGGSADLATDAQELDLSLSAGARSVNIRVTVEP